MTQSFSQIPGNIRTPFLFTEFDSSNAVSGAQKQPYKALFLGQMLPSGSAVANEVVRVTSAKEAILKFGLGSMLADMCEAYFDNNSFTEMFCLPLVDLVSGVKAKGSVTFVGAPTVAGTIVYRIMGKKVSFGVTAADTSITCATKLIAALASISQVTATVDGVSTSKVNIEYNHKGLLGNELDIRQGYYTDEKGLPAGLTSTIAAFSGGAGNPDIASALALIPEEQFNVIGLPYTDSSNLALISSFLDVRFGAMVAKDGMAFTSSNKNLSGLGTLGDSINSKFISIGESYKSPSGPHQWVGAKVGVVAFEMSNDAARPLQTVILKGILPAEEKECFKMSERNLLLYDGISTHKRTANGEVALETTITTYKVNDAGADDESYLYVETFFTLSYLRYDWNNYIARKYPRHKLGDDGNTVAPGQPVMTPNLYKAELIGRYIDWMGLGYVENLDAFKASIKVEKNSGNKNRLDANWAPDLMNQFRVGANKISFIL